MKPLDQERLITILTQELLEVLSPSGSESRTSESVRKDSPHSVHFEGRLLTEACADRFIGQGARVLILSPETLVTALARDRAAEAGLELRVNRSSSFRTSEPPAKGRGLSVYLGLPGIGHERLVSQVADAAGWQIATVCGGGRRRFQEMEEVARCLEEVSTGEARAAVLIAEEIYPILRRARRCEALQPVVGWDPASVASQGVEKGTNVLILSGRQLGSPMLRRLLVRWLGGGS